VRGLAAQSQDVITMVNYVREEQGSGLDMLMTNFNTKMMAIFYFDALRNSSAQGLNQ